MQDMPWMRPDFDLRQVIGADASGAFQATLERGLDDLAKRLEQRRSVCRDMALSQRIDALLDACKAGLEVVTAAAQAARAA